MKLKPLFFLLFFLIPKGIFANIDYISIKAVGDIVPGTNFPNRSLPRNPEKIFFYNVVDYLQDSDILFGNFESTLTRYPKTRKNTKRKRVFAFRSPPSYALMLRRVGFDVLSIANNHSMDFYQKGYDDTIKFLKKANILPVGVKKQIAVLNIEDIPVAFIGFSHLDYHNNLNRISQAKRLVQKAKSEGELVIVSFHGGKEGKSALHVKNEMEIFYGERRGNLVQFAHSVIDAGADLVLGHGPHVPRALELYKNKLIAYSLGNFLGYGALSSRGYAGYSMILEVKLNMSGDFIQGEIISLRLNQLSIPKYDFEKKTVRLVKRLSKQDFPNSPLIIKNNGKIFRKKQN